MSKESPNNNPYSYTIDNFKIEKTIGEGTFGKVKIGIHIPTGEKVAIKILEKDKIQDNEDLERITREIKYLKILKHPNIIQIFQIIEDKKNYYLIMEFAKCGELFTHIVNNKRLSETEAAIFYTQLIKGLSFIHKHNIVHRDIKPENLLLKENNILTIIDFGLSNQYQPGGLLLTPCGSPCYAAPEMILGRYYSGLMVDIWSSGIVLYAMVCGYLPFEDKNNDKLYKKILSGHFEIPDRLSPNCKDLITKILKVNPKKRIKLEEIMKHPFLKNGMEWYNNIFSEYFSKTVGVDEREIEINNEIVEKMVNEMGYSNANNNIVNNILNNKHNNITTTYYLLLNKLNQTRINEEKKRSIIENDSVSKDEEEQEESENKEIDMDKDAISQSNPTSLSQKMQSVPGSPNSDGKNTVSPLSNKFPINEIETEKEQRDDDLSHKINNINITSYQYQQKQKQRDYSVTTPSNRLPTQNPRFCFNINPVEKNPPQNGEREPSLDVSNIIKNHKNEVALIDNSPCLITPLNRKILQKLPNHNRNKKNAQTPNNNNTVNLSSVSKTHTSSFSNNKIDTSITYDNTNIFLKSIEHGKKKQYRVNGHNVNNSTIHNKIVYIPSNTINLMDEDDASNKNQIKNSNSRTNSTSSMKKSSSNTKTNRSFSQKEKFEKVQNVSSNINSHKNIYSFHYSKGLKREKNLSLSSNKDFSPSSRSSSKTKNITLKTANVSTFNTPKVSKEGYPNSARQSGGLVNNLSSKKQNQKKHQNLMKKPTIIDIDITSNNSVNTHKKTSTNISLKSTEKNVSKTKANNILPKSSTNSSSKRTNIHIHGFVDLSKNPKPTTTSNKKKATKTNIQQTSKRKMSTSSVNSANTNVTEVNENSSKQHTTSNSFALCTTNSTHDEVVEKLNNLCKDKQYELTQNTTNTNGTQFLCSKSQNQICIEISKVGPNNVLKLYHLSGNEQVTKEIIKEIIIEIGF